MGKVNFRLVCLGLVRVVLGRIVLRIWGRGNKMGNVDFRRAYSGLRRTVLGRIEYGRVHSRKMYLPIVISGWF